MKKNVASQVVTAQILGIDGTPYTQDVLVYVTIDNGTQTLGTVGSGAASHKGNGLHSYLPSQAETNGDHIAFTFVGVGSDPAAPVTIQIFTGFPQTGDSFARIGAPVGASISADIAAIASAVAQIATDTGTTIPAVLAAIEGYVDTEVAAILADTTDIKTRLPAALVSGRIDASVGAMATDVLNAAALAADAVTEIQSGLATSSALAAVQSDTDDLQSRLPAALVNGRIDASVGAMASNTLTASALATDAVNEIVDAVWDEVLTGATHNVPTSAGRRLREVRSALYSGTAQAGAATSITLDTGASTTNNLYAGEMVSIVNGTGAGQTRTIISYTGSSRVALVDRAWVINPDNTSEFAIEPSDDRAIVQDGKAQAGAASTITLDTDASTTNNLYVGMTVHISAGTGNGQARLITGYVGSTRVATVQPAWTVTPDNTSIYLLKPTAQSTVGSINGGAADTIAGAVWDKATSSHTAAGSFGEAAGDTDLRGRRTVVRGTVGTATTPSATQFTPSALSPAGAATDQFKGRIIVFDNDTLSAGLRGQATDITASTASALPLLTFTALSVIPADGDTFSIV